MADLVAKHVEEVDQGNAWWAVNRLQGGDFVQNIANALGFVSAAVLAAGEKSKGEVIIKISVKRPTTAKYVSTEASVNTKVPSAPLYGGQWFFVDLEGQLTNDDPENVQLTGFREVPPVAGGEARVVPEGAAEARKVQ